MFEKYGLKEPNFRIDPKRNPDVFYGKEDLAESLVTVVRRSLMVGRSSKAVFYGEIGVGKTQLLQHLAFKLKEEVVPVYIECPAFHRRTSYITGLHSVIMSFIGLTRVRQLLGHLVGTLTTEPVDLKVDNPELERIIREGWRKGQDVMWKFISGGRLTSAEMKVIGSVHPQISEDDAVDVLNILAELIEKVEGKKLLLLIDEFENTNVLRGDALSMFVEAVRKLADGGNSISVVFAATCRSLEELRVLNNPTVKSRIGLSNYIEIEEYSETELRDLIGKVTRYKRAENFDVKRAISAAARSVSETLSEEVYPFTVEAVDELVDGLKLLRDDGIIPVLRPRETLDIMDGALAVAMERNRPVIDSAAVREALKPLG